MEHIYPHPDRDGYPVHCGPPAWYPAEPNVRPVYAGNGSGAYDPSVFHRPHVAKLEHTPYPEPEVTSTWTWENWEEAWFPSSPRAFAKKARAAGWDVRIGFSRGSIEGAKANTYVTRDMIGVWLDGHGRRAVVLWERNPDAEFTAKKLEAGIKPGEIPSGMVWKAKGGSIRFGPGMAFPYPNLTEMEEWVALQGRVLPSWYEACRQRVVDARARTTQAEPVESTV